MSFGTISASRILKDGLVLVRLWFSTVRTSLALLHWAIWILMAIDSVRISMHMTRNGGVIVHPPPQCVRSLMSTRGPMRDDGLREDDV